MWAASSDDEERDGHAAAHLAGLREGCESEDEAGWEQALEETEEEDDDDSDGEAGWEEAEEDGDEDDDDAEEGEGGHEDEEVEVGEDEDEGRPPEEQLLDAAQNNMVGLVISLIDTVPRVDRNYADECGWTAAHRASTHGHLGVLRVLLARSADPDPVAFGDWDWDWQRRHWTPTMLASCHGHLNVVQLLATYGANMGAVEHKGEHIGEHIREETARSEAERGNHPEIVAFLDVIESWHPIRIAIACRLHADLRLLLKTGSIDPVGWCPLSVLMGTATSPDELWPGQPKPCPATTCLARAAMAKWSPATHWLHHGGFRKVVWTVLLVAQRLKANSTLPVLAVLGWHGILGELRRRDW